MSLDDKIPGETASTTSAATGKTLVDVKPREVQASGLKGGGTTITPRAYEHNGTIYVTYAVVNGTNIDVYATAFNLDTGEWSSTKTLVGSAPDDRHHLPSLTVDADGYVYVTFYWRNSGGGGGTGELHKSDNPEDVSSFSKVTDVDTDADYPSLAANGTDLYIFHRDTSNTARPLVVKKSTDGGSTWTQTDLVNETSQWVYHHTAYPDGSGNIILGIEFRDDGSAPWTDGSVLRYDMDTDTLHGADGSSLATPATLADLGSVDSQLTTGEALVSGVYYDPASGDWLAAGTKAGSGANWGAYDFVVWRYDSSAASWSTTRLDMSTANGGGLQFMKTSDGDLRIVDSYLRSENETTSAQQIYGGYWESGDNGRTWTRYLRPFNRENSIRWPFRVRGGDGSMQFAAIETQPESHTTTPYELVAVDEDLEWLGGSGESTVRERPRSNTSVRGYPSADQSALASGSWHQMNVDGVRSGITNAELDPSTNAFAPRKDGVYLVTAQATLSGLSGGDQITIRVMKDGTESRRATTVANGTEESISVVEVVGLEAGEPITVEVLNSTSSFTIEGDTHKSFLDAAGVSLVP